MCMPTKCTCTLQNYLYKLTKIICRPVHHVNVARRITLDDVKRTTANKTQYDVPGNPQKLVVQRTLKKMKYIQNKSSNFS